MNVRVGARAERDDWCATIFGLLGAIAGTVELISGGFFGAVVGALV